MKSPRDPSRWRDRDADADLLEARAAVLADAASEVAPLAPPALSRIRQAVRARRSDRRGFELRGFSARARIAFGVGLFLFCATTVGGASVLWRKVVVPLWRAPAPVSAPSAPKARHRTARVGSRAPAGAPQPADDQTPVEPEALAAPEVAAPGVPAPPAALAPPAVDRDRPRPTPRPGPALVPAPPPRVTEARLLAEALTALRQQHDPRAALAALDRYAQAFPHGVLETEAFRTRVEAVIRLDDLKTALALLDGKRAGTDALGTDLLLTRAELRAAVDRFREALGDFDRVLDSAAAHAAGAEERALYGRAVCLGRLAENARARAELLAYQRRFPNGRFAAEVQRLLAGAPAASP